MRLYDGEEAIVIYKMSTTTPCYGEWDTHKWDEHAYIVNFLLMRTTRAGQIILLDALPFPVHELVAGDTNTPTHILEIYYGAWADEWVLEQLAGNPSTPSETLRLLASSQSPWVRQRLRDNWNTPEDVLLQLSPQQDNLPRS